LRALESPPFHKSAAPMCKIFLLKAGYRRSYRLDRLRKPQNRGAIPL